ncbi:unnamed protein product [Brachionus calyciflorus]|uniref:Uncharacterized protein n=1 Tax=Brachionus calyciflorus TaxID=104777 RepID=A0A814KB46_9BILA|nr:unnamed protein product [Brachionus calyciflorus]
MVRFAYQVLIEEQQAKINDQQSKLKFIAEMLKTERQNISRLEDQLLEKNKTIKQIKQELFEANFNHLKREETLSNNINDNSSVLIEGATQTEVDNSVEKAIQTENNSANTSSQIEIINGQCDSNNSDEKIKIKAPYKLEAGDML